MINHIDVRDNGGNLLAIIHGPREWADNSYLAVSYVRDSDGFLSHEEKTFPTIDKAHEWAATLTA